MAATRSTAVRQHTRGDLSMRKTGKFVLSKKALNDESGPKAITVNIKSGEVIKVNCRVSTRAVLRSEVLITCREK